MNIGILNSGGDCPGLNAVIEGAVGAAARRGWTTIGFEDGFEGLLSDGNNPRYKILTPEHCRGLRAMGGTILGTVNKGNFAIKIGVNQKGEIEPAVLAKTKETIDRLNIKALIVVGGDGSQSTSLLLSAIGLPVVGVPKTIDNDLGATDVTFGFNSAVTVVSEALDRLKTTANAHQRMMVVEVMGRHAGWIALEGGIAGSADVILLPEIPFDLDIVIKSIEQRKLRKQREILVVVSEGAKIANELVLVDGQTKGEVRLGGIGNIIAEKLEEATGIETRSCVLGHTQRGGSPIAFDRILGTRFGAYAITLIERKQFSHMVALHGTEMVSVPIEEAVKTLKIVDPACQLVETARDLGICFGDAL
ncbi:MAG: ATP-dependent 6-phosphofructokinase [Akkermansia sp.]